MKELHELHNHNRHINTFSGRKINLFAPTADQICMIDICKGLAYNPHFGGQTPKYFSIAQHSMLVEELCPERTDHRKLLAALLHDAPEAYMGDMLKPLKIHMDLYVKLEKQLSKVIFEKYKLPIELLKEVKPYDLEAQEYEYAAFYKRNTTFNYWGPEKALKKFIAKIVDNEYFAGHFNKALEFLPPSVSILEWEKKCWTSSKQ